MVLFPVTSLWTLQCELVTTFYKNERRQKREARFLNRVSRLSLFLAEASYNRFLLRPMIWAHGLSGAFSHLHQALKKKTKKIQKIESMLIAFTLDKPLQNNSILSWLR